MVQGQRRRDPYGIPSQPLPQEDAKMLCEKLAYLNDGYRLQRADEHPRCRGTHHSIQQL